MMTCTVCRHQAREDVDRALVGGESQRVIATRYGLTQAAVGRHSQNHLPATLVEASVERGVEHGQALLSQVEWLLGETKDSMTRSKTDGKEKDFLAGARETRHTMELVGRLTGELKEESRAGIHIDSIQYIQMMSHIFTEAELREIIAGRTYREILEGKGYDSGTVEGLVGTVEYIEQAIGTELVKVN